jgi:hypothetical protein
MTTPKNPVIDLLIMRDRDAWRLLLAPISWVPGILASRMDARREIFPVRNPGADDLDAFMLESDAPYEGGKTADGGVQVLTKGRSAICLLIWLEGVVRM